MPFKSEAQRRYFEANNAKLEKQGVDVKEWNNQIKVSNFRSACTGIEKQKDPNTQLFLNCLPHIRSHHTMLLDEFLQFRIRDAQFFRPVFKLIGFVDVYANTVRRPAFSFIVCHLTPLPN
jgi:hypothetical protein